VKIYADRPATALRQMLTDVLVLIWVYAWVRGALWTQDQVQKLGVPGQKLELAGTGVADNLADVGGKVGRVPLVGDDLTAPFTRAADAARGVADAGRQQQEAVHTLGWVSAVVMLVLPLGLVLLWWLPRRLGWMRRAGVAVTVRDQEAGADLLALRALATQPLNKLAALGPNIARSWRDGDRSAVDALAALELSNLGLRGRR
jgi:hypothetical protein